MKTRTIVVLEDGDTWSSIDGCSICVVSEEEYNRLLAGEKVKHVEVLAEISLTLT